MKIKSLFGIILVVIILGLILLLLSQESYKEAVVEEKNTTAVEQKTSKAPLSEEEQVLEDLKKQAGVNLENSVSIYYLTHCSSCHGKDGGGTQVAPTIKGKSYDYMIAKLDDYRNDRVVNSLMKGLLLNTSDEELKVLAKEISNFK